MLPLDLHVLSLPLAFILSQDQTLRCIYKKFKSLSLQMQSSQKLTKLVHLAFFVIFFCSKMLKNSLHKKSAPLVFPLNADVLLFCRFHYLPSIYSLSGETVSLFRGGKGNNSFYSAKTFCKIYEVFFVSNYLALNSETKLLKTNYHHSIRYKELRC